MEAEQQQEQKQLFLRKEILEQNYDPQKFIDFLVTKKGETAADINNWTLEELKSVVVEFKSLKKRKQQIKFKIKIITKIIQIKIKPKIITYFTTMN